MPLGLLGCCVATSRQEEGEAWGSTTPRHAGWPKAGAGSSLGPPVAAEFLRRLPRPGQGGEGLRGFWAAYVSLDLRGLASRSAYRAGLEDLAALDEIRERCLEAARPFSLALHLLLDQWGRCTEDKDECRIIFAVRRLLGCLEDVGSLTSRAEGGGVPCTNVQLHARYLQQVRAFQFIASALRFGWQKDARKSAAPPMHEAFAKKALALAVAQAAVPEGWRRAPSTSAPPAGDGIQGLCLARHGR